MAYTRIKLEQIVLGTLMNDISLLQTHRVSIRKEMFSDKRNAFVFGIIEQMFNDGLTETAPYDVFVYSLQNNIRYGDANKFCVYMCQLTDNYAVVGFPKYLRDLVKIYLSEVKNGKL